MSRTHKRLPTGTVRSPRGRKQALINDVRKGAIPPDAWEDLPFDDQCYKGITVALELHKKGEKQEDIANHLVEQYGYKRWEVQQMRWYVTGKHYGCDCEECRSPSKKRHELTSWSAEMSYLEGSFKLKETIGPEVYVPVYLLEEWSYYDGHPNSGLCEIREECEGLQGKYWFDVFDKRWVVIPAKDDDEPNFVRLLLFHLIEAQSPGTPIDESMVVGWFHEYNLVR